MIRVVDLLLFMKINVGSYKEVLVNISIMIRDYGGISG